MAIQEGVVLGGLNLNPATGNFAVEAIDFPPPKKKPEWAQSADSDGADLIRTPLFENRTIPITVRIQPQASMNATLEKLGELVDVIQEAEKNPGGIPLEWTPANSTKTITFYVLTGEVVDIPIVVEGEGVGWFVLTPQVKISLTCKPFGYGPEVEGAAAKANETGLSIVTLTVPTVAGDVPAEGRLVVTDTAAAGRRYVEWGLQQRYYNPATSLVLDSEDMVPIAGGQSTALNASGAYKRPGATNGTLATTLYPEATICANTGNLSHVGTFRVKARAEAILGSGSTPSNIHCRLSWQDGQGPLRANEWQTPILAGAFVELDLGTVTVTPALAGTQKWLGQIEAYSEGAPGGDALHLDYITLIPVLEGYGKARGIEGAGSGTVIAFDNFTTGTLSGALNGRTAPLGGAWATSGSTTDFTVTASEGAKRETVSDASRRFAVLGGSVADQRVRATYVKYPSEPSYLGYLREVVARWSATNTYASLAATNLGGENVALELYYIVGGTATVVNEVNIVGRLDELELTARSDGSIVGRAFLDGVEVATLSGSGSALATGGGLAIGKGGIADYNFNPSAEKRALRRLQVEQLPSVPFCIQPSGASQFRSDSTITTDSTGTYYGTVPIYRGSRFFVPQDGSANRTSRVLVKADRYDLEQAAQQIIGDGFKAQVFVTPRYHVIPR